MDNGNYFFFLLEKVSTINFNPNANFGSYDGSETQKIKSELYRKTVDSVLKYLPGVADDCDEEEAQYKASCYVDVILEGMYKYSLANNSCDVDIETFNYKDCLLNYGER